jgi:hypothetical protein
MKAISMTPSILTRFSAHRAGLDREWRSWFRSVTGNVHGPGNGTQRSA